MLAYLTSEASNRNSYLTPDNASRLSRGSNEEDDLFSDQGDEMNHRQPYQIWDGDQGQEQGPGPRPKAIWAGGWGPVEN